MKRIRLWQGVEHNYSSGFFVLKRCSLLSATPWENVESAPTGAAARYQERRQPVPALMRDGIALLSASTNSWQSRR